MYCTCTIEVLSSVKLVLLFPLFQVVDLYQGLQSRRCAILTGACGSGKTTVYQTLSKAYNSLMNSPMIKGHVYLHVVNPAAYSVKEVHTM